MAFKEFYKELIRDLPDRAIQRTKSADTRKGYDTTGFGYQWLVNRLNEVFGDQWGYHYEIIKELQGNYKSGQAYWEITCICQIWILDKENIRASAGGHLSVTYYDSLKGAQTNAFKKAAAYWGVGKSAYEGTVDDDLKPHPDRMEERSIPATQAFNKDNKESCPDCGAEMRKSKFPDKQTNREYYYCSNYKQGCKGRVFIGSHKEESESQNYRDPIAFEPAPPITDEDLPI